MYQVLDICRYVINYSNEKGYGISNLKLQKILYFIQAYFLINSNGKKPCFSESIEAWDFGPVVPVAYREYKQYGSSNIPQILSYIDYKEGNIWDAQRVAYDDGMILSVDKAMIKDVVDKFADYSATDLVTLTHNQRPWKSAYVPNKNHEITLSDMWDYFNEEQTE
ncbi:MAG: DUF4065 domain-containing protein [Lachnospiraceae bacterium]|nr:DUF4065 domain-containing protein [Lachnospiraceae bacterium]